MVLENKFNIIMNRKKIQRIMRKYNITCPIRKANPYKRIAKATKEHRVAPNRLNREFKQNIPGKVMLTDITYMPYGNNKMAYLSTIKDSSTNEILAYNLSNNLAIDIVTETINKLYIKMHLFILTKALIIQVQSFKNCLKNITWVNLCLVEAIVGIMLRKNHSSDI